MENITVQRRGPKERVNQLRKSGFVPCIVFGGGLKDSLPTKLDEKTAQKLVQQKRKGSRVQLILDGEEIPVQIKEKDVNHLNNEIVHLSFQALKKGQKVNSVVHVLVDNADVVAGILERQMTEIPYSSLPSDMIDTITIDVDGMPIGTVITIGDIKEFQSEKIELQADKETIVLRINDKIMATKAEGTEEVSE